MHGIYGAGKTMDETLRPHRNGGKGAQIYMLTAHLPRQKHIQDADMLKLIELFGISCRKDFLDL